MSVVRVSSVGAVAAGCPAVLLAAGRAVLRRHAAAREGPEGCT